jgi:hypothetical protein
LDFDISGSLDKSKTPGSCGFPLPNPQSAAIVDFVPYVLSELKSLKIRSKFDYIKDV